GLERASQPDVVGEVFAAYLTAKAAAEEDLRSRDLDWTILRPGRLTDDEPIGKVHLAESVDYGTIPRADVAALLLELLDEPGTTRQTLEVISGDVAIPQAVAAVARV
ncbi:MAG: NAD(P)H-binding protein, partial [Thermocrispum agreste]